MNPALMILLLFDEVDGIGTPLPPQQFFWITETPGEYVVDENLERVIVTVS